MNIFLPQIEVLEFLKAADLSGKLFYLIIEHVQHFQVLKVSNVWRYGYRRENNERAKTMLNTQSCKILLNIHSLESHSKH